MFQLTQEEKEELVAKCDHLKTLKYSPNLPYKHMLLKRQQLEQKATAHDQNIQTIFMALKQLLNPVNPPRDRTGFKRNNEKRQSSFYILRRVFRSSIGCSSTPYIDYNFREQWCAEAHNSETLFDNYVTSEATVGATFVLSIILIQIKSI